MIRALQLAAAAAVVAALFGWFGVAPVTAALARASAPGLLLYATLTATVVVGYALRWRVVAAALGSAPPFARLIAARLAGDAIGALVPSARLAGEPVRVLLTRDAAAAAGQSAAAVAIDRLLEVIGNILAVLAYVAVICAVRGARGAGAGALLAGAAMLLALLAVLVLLGSMRAGRRPLAVLYEGRLRVAPGLARYAERLRGFEAHVVRFCRDHPREFALGVLGSVLIELAIVAQYLALFGAFAIGLDLPTLFAVLLGSGVARAAPTPAALGALEATQVALVGAAAGQPELGLVVAVIIRLHETLLLVAGLAALAAAGTSLTRLRAAAARTA